MRYIQKLPPVEVFHPIDGTHLEYVPHTKAMRIATSVAAQEGLFVSWGGFKNSVYKQASTLFFKIRLWSQKELFEQLFANYDKLDDDLKAELPLKRIWTVAAQEEE